MNNFFTVFVLVTGMVFSGIHVRAAGSTYIGSEACGQCHETEYEHYIQHSKKSGSYESIRKMKHKLTQDEYHSCFECHTTGYGKPGGFVSEEKTPHLKNAGCESCHGPGSSHADTQDPDDITRDITMAHCCTCHNENRVKAFGFKPLKFGGAH